MVKKSTLKALLADKNLILLLTFWLGLRMFFAAVTSLGNDEVYYTLYAQTWELSYFDHPGLLGWVLNLFTFSGYSISGFWYRLPALLGSVLNVFLVLKITKALNSNANSKTTLIWACSSIYLSVVSGLFILPDSVQLTPYLASVLFFIWAIKRDYKASYILAAFTLSGIAFLGKYHALFIPFGFVSYALLLDHKLWLKPAFYLGGIVNLLFLLPVYFWNKAHDFISFTYHGNRVGFLENGFNFNSFLQFNLGELFYNNPITVIASITALLYGIKKRKLLEKGQLLILCVSLPMIIVFTLLSTSKTTLPHWSGASFVLLIAFMMSLKTERVKWFAKPKVALSALGFLGLCLILGYTHIQTGVFGQSGVKTLPKDGVGLEKLGKNDFTLDLYNWDDFAQKLNTTIDSVCDGQNIPLISHKWFPAAHLDFYLAKRHNKTLFGLGAVQDVHQYLYLNKKRQYNSDSEHVIYIALSTQYASPNYLIKDFPYQNLEAVVPQYRGGEIVRIAYLYKLSKVSL